MCVQERKKISKGEVAKHDKDGDAWVVVGGKVYDLTEWVHRHPGGSIPLLQIAGRDATDAFRAYHGPKGKAAKTLASYCIGELDKEDSLETHMADFRDMVGGLEGEFKTDYAHYYRLAACLATLLAAAVACVLATSSVWTHMLGAVLLGIFWQQTMFIGHDAGHGAITHNHKNDFYIGLLVGNLCNGVGITWWCTTHNVHHCACNSVECDPDIQHMPVLAVSSKYFNSVYSLYHQRRLTYDAAAKFLVSIQHLTFYPLMAVARFNLYAQGLILLATQAKKLGPKKVFFELAGMATYFAWLGALVAQLPTRGEQIGFLLLSHAVGGIIHVQICLSHFSRDVFDGRPESNKWVDMQLSGTMDIDCPKWMDWFHGGLQFQTEHHLCPRMPRHKLREFRDKVIRPYCSKHGLQHDCPTFLEANIQVWRTLRKASKEAKLSPHFVHAVNCEG